VERISPEERRRRLLVRHRLAPGARAGTPLAAVRSLVALHSTDAATVYLSTWARVGAFDPAALDEALYAENTLVRMLGMRRTLWVVPDELAAIVDAACTQRIAVRERTRLEGFVAASGVTEDPGAWLGRVERAALAAVQARDGAFTAELTRENPLLATKLTVGPGTRWETRVSAGSRILPLLAAEGVVARGRPRGSWVSGVYRWEPVLQPRPRVDPHAARADLLRAWLSAFGPATETDTRWWAGWTARDAREALADVPHAVVDLDGAPGLVLAGDLERTPSPAPCAALLPTLDPTVMGWKQRDWYLGAHGALLFDRNGNAGPTVWWDGRVVGGWTQRSDGEVVWKLLEDVGADATAAVEAEAARLETWLGDVRVSPGFLPPFQRALAS
jgi:hypothetical protein